MFFISRASIYPFEYYFSTIFKADGTYSLPKGRCQRSVAANLNCFTDVPNKTCGGGHSTYPVANIRECELQCNFYIFY